MLSRSCRIFHALALLIALTPAIAAAQTYLPPDIGLPPQSVIGNSLTRPGNAVAVSFAQLRAGLGIPTSQSCSSHNWFSTVSAGGVLGCSQPGVLDISGFGANVQNALGVGVGTAGSIVVNGGALGTPSSGNAANLSGLPIAGVAGLGSGVAAALGNPLNGSNGLVGFSGNIGVATGTSLALSGLVNVTGASGYELGGIPNFFTTGNFNVVTSPTGSVSGSAALFLGNATGGSGAFLDGSSVTFRQADHSTNFVVVTPSSASFLQTTASTSPTTGALTVSGGIGVGGALNVGGGIAGSLAGSTGLPLSTGVTGNLPVGNLNSGTAASSSTFWRGDGQWATPSGSGNVSGTGSSIAGNVPKLSNTSTTGIVDNGTPASALPTTIGQLPAATPSASTVTISIASPAVITWTAHGLAPNSTIVFSSTGALPTGLVANTTYYLIGSSITTNTFEVATSVANAIAGIAINTSGTQSGTQTATANLNADPTSVGAYIELDVPQSSFVTLPTPTGVANVASVSMPAGRWLMWGNVVFLPQGSTVYNEVHVSLSLVSATADTSPGSAHAFHTDFGAAQAAIIPTANKYLTFTTPTTVFLIANTTIVSGSPMLAFGSIFALRMP
jgi:hypothetical protein